jgi:hypothetical protein
MLPKVQPHSALGAMYGECVPYQISLQAMGPLHCPARKRDFVLKKNTSR